MKLLFIPKIQLILKCQASSEIHLEKMPNSGLCDWKYPHRKGIMVPKYWGCIVTLAAGVCFKPRYSYYNRLVTLFSVPYGMCLQTLHSDRQRFVSPTSTNSSDNILQITRMEEMCLTAHYISILVRNMPQLLKNPPRYARLRNMTQYQSILHSIVYCLTANVLCCSY